MVVTKYLLLFQKKIRKENCGQKRDPWANAMLFVMSTLKNKTPLGKRKLVKARTALRQQGSILTQIYNNFKKFYQFHHTARELPHTFSPQPLNFWKTKLARSLIPGFSWGSKRRLSLSTTEKHTQVCISDCLQWSLFSLQRWHDPAFSSPGSVLCRIEGLGNALA